MAWQGNGLEMPPNCPTALCTTAEHHKDFNFKTHLLLERQLIPSKGKIFFFVLKDIYFNGRAALDIVWILTAQVPRCKSSSWRSAAALKGRPAWPLTCVPRSLQVSKSHVGSPDIHSQSLQQSLFSARFSHKYKAPHNLETFIFNFWASQSSHQAHIMWLSEDPDQAINGVRFFPKGLSQTVMFISRWPFQNQPLDTHRSTRHFQPSAKKTYTSPDFPWLWSYLNVLNLCPSSHWLTLFHALTFSPGPFPGSQDLCAEWGRSSHWTKAMSSWLTSLYLVPPAKAALGPAHP